VAKSAETVAGRRHKPLGLVRRRQPQSTRMPARPARHPPTQVLPVPHRSQPRLTVAHGLNPSVCANSLDVVAELNEELAPFRILTGIEVDILEDGSLDQDETLLARLDIVVASVQLEALHGPRTHDKAHGGRRREPPYRHPWALHRSASWWARVGPSPGSNAELVFAACARTGTAVEINSRPERRDPPDPLLRQALELGCLVSIDTDAHAPGQLEWFAQRDASRARRGRRARTTGLRERLAPHTVAGLDGRHAA